MVSVQNLCQSWGFFLLSFLHYKISFDFYYLIFISFYNLQIQKKVILLIWYLITNTSINWLLKSFSMKHLMCQGRFVAQCRQCDSHKFVWNQWIGYCVVAASQKKNIQSKTFYSEQLDFALFYSISIYCARAIWKYLLVGTSLPLGTWNMLDVKLINDLKLHEISFKIYTYFWLLLFFLLCFCL